MSSRISICIPTYKQPERLAKLLQSIEKQTVAPFEVIVSDDSDDDSVKLLCDNFALPIKYFHNDLPLGSPENWNNAISKAEGEWIKLMHHDDYFTHSKALEMLLQVAIGNSDIDYIFSGTTIEYDDNRRTEVYSVSKQLIDHLDEIPAYLFHKNLIGAPSTGFFKKSVTLTYDRALMWLVDIEYYARLLKQFKVAYLSDPLVTTVISDVQLTTQLKNNRNVEVREFMHCYCKLINSMNTLNKKIMRSRLLHVFYDFDIKSKSDLQSIGMNKPIPNYIKLILFFMQVNRKLTFSIFYRLNNFNINKLW
jgi:glycosyltransferase involved in cell wall biosynthesis